MDQDEAFPSGIPSTLEIVPPHPWSCVRKTAVVGVGLTAAAAALGAIASLLTDAPSLISTLRLLLVSFGVITCGFAVSMRPDLWRSWGLAAAASLLGYFGTPEHWDTLRLVMGVLTGAAFTGTVIAAATERWRYILGTLLISFHFFGIFMATVSPPPTPWLAEQIYNRYYMPYLQFMYLRNAYHFYSPQPGPTSFVVFLLKTEIGDEPLADGTRRKRYEYRWVVLPQRLEGTRDPMGLTYIRRLSLTHHASQVQNEVAAQSFERAEVHERRKELAIRLGGQYYPFHPAELMVNQYRVPTPDVMRYVLPSYAQHVILEYTPDAAAAAKTTVKIYRLEHETLTVADINGGVDPFDPLTYRAFFLGEYGFRPDATDPQHKRVRITLLDPQEKMLYWLIPVLPRSTSPSPGSKQRAIEDYLSAHALGVPVEDLEKEPYASRVLNWSLLR